MKAKNVLKVIGQTPIIRINKMFEPELNVWIKLEHLNPGGSIKDRIALAMIEDAEANGLLNESITIIEPTSGNTGIGLAMVAAVKGYNLILVMPDSMSIERRNTLKAYGAKLVLTPRAEGMKGAINKAIELSKAQSSWMPMQFENTANPMVHYTKTAIEILKDFDGSIDFLITGVGTGGHISGISRALKKEIPQLKVMAVEPVGSDVIGGGKPGPHAIQGIGAGFVPKNLDLSMIDGTISISKEEAFEFCRSAAKLEGLLVGISTGASLAAIAKKSELLKDKTVLTLAYDRGNRYLSVEGLFI